MSIIQEFQEARSADVAAVVVIDDHIQIWFGSPTGGSSDSHITTIPCRNAKQAEAIAKRHRAVWGLTDRNEKIEVLEDGTTTVELDFV